jgi:transglutaminase-like putative cysteine protease
VKLFAVCALVVVSQVAAAQAPRITPRGDPSVRADSIYALAVDPADYPELTQAYLLDDGVLRLDADGRGTRTFRAVIQILRPEAIENYNELQFSWAPKHERFTLNWARVVRPDGSVISAGPNQTQESDIPAETGDPIYNDSKVLRASLSGVAVGTIVDYSWTTEETKPFLPGDGLYSWSVTNSIPVRRSRYIIDVPADVQLRVLERNLTNPRTETVVGRRRVYSWVAKDLAPIKVERFASDSNSILQSVTAALPTTWQAIGAWYAENSRDRYRMTPAVEEKLASLVKGARTLDDSLRAVHKYAAQDVRYVSIAIGLGGYQPRTPAEVLRTGFGDCKDKATIFIAMLRAMGVEAHPVILHSTGGVIEELPSLTQFNHAIAAFRRPGSDKFEYTDLTALYTPFGELPFGPQGEFGIMVYSNGMVEEVTLPLTNVNENGSEIVVRVTVDTAGRVNGTFEERHRGHRAPSFRDIFAAPRDATQRTQLANNVAANWFTGATGADLDLPEGRDLAQPAEVSLRIVDGQAFTSAGSILLMRVPVVTGEGALSLVRELEAAGPRRFPISTQGIFGYSEDRVFLEITLPDGWKAELPPSVHEEGPWGLFRKSYTQDGNVLRIERHARGTSATLPPERIGDVTAMFRRLAADNASTLVIRR